MLQFNDNNEVITNEEYRAILVGLQLNEDITNSMEELNGLAEAANVVVLGQMIQNLEKNHEFILIDTVGFVSKLPHSLIKAFKATLEEVLYADLLLQVVDASYEAHDFHIEVTNRVLEEIGAADKEKILIYNKIDLLEEEFMPTYTGEAVNVSVKEEKNIDELIELIKKKIFSNRVTAKLLIPYERGDISSYLCEKGRVIEMEYLESGTLFHVELERSDYNRLKDYDTV